jgi:hypothetical protein
LFLYGTEAPGAVAVLAAPCVKAGVEQESSKPAATVAKNALSSFMFSSLHCHEFYQHALFAGRAVTSIDPFRAAEARRLVERFEWHYTPKHGSWLNLAESELGVLSAQWLDRRITEKQTLTDEIAAWERDHNANPTSASPPRMLAHRRTNNPEQYLTKEQQKPCLDRAAVELVQEITQQRPLN